MMEILKKYTVIFSVQKVNQLELQILFVCKLLENFFILSMGSRRKAVEEKQCAWVLCLSIRFMFKANTEYRRGNSVTGISL